MTDITTLLRQGPQPEARLRADARAAAERVTAAAASDGTADIVYAPLDTPVGPVLLAATALGLVRLAYVDDGVDAVLDDLSRRVSPRIVAAAGRLDGPRRELEEYFRGHRQSFEVPIDWCLVSEFARQVLACTAAIPYGSVSSYAQVAAGAGSPRGSRAAGNALGANPIPIIVPCHRVLRSGGGLGGYTGGLERKRFLLELEDALDRSLTGAEGRPVGTG